MEAQLPHVVSQRMNFNPRGNRSFMSTSVFYESEAFFSVVVQYFGLDVR